MPKSKKDSGIVVINGTAYDAKTGLPQEDNKHAAAENKKKNPQQMTDLSSNQQVQQPQKKMEVQKNEDNQNNKQINNRPKATRAQQLHTIKSGSNEQVLDLRKTARAKKLKEEQRNKIQQNNTEGANNNGPLNEPGTGPKMSKLDTRARISRARQYQKSDSIHKFFPNNQPSNSNKSEAITVNRQSSQRNDVKQSSKEKRVNQEVVAPVREDMTNQVKQEGKEYTNLNERAKTRELEKLVQKHPRYVETKKNKSSTPEQLAVAESNDSEQEKRSIFSVFKFRPRIASYATAAMAALVLVGFVAYLNMPQMALQVAANRAGFEASMPAYKPSGFSFNGPISYAPGQIVISFGSHSDDRSFEVIQRKTTWDSTSLLENYVTQESSDYIPVQQNGLTIYLFDDNGAAWVDGGVWYTIQGDSGLNSEQLLKVATSL